MSLNGGDTDNANDNASQDGGIQAGGSQSTTNAMTDSTTTVNSASNASSTASADAAAQGATTSAGNDSTPYSSGQLAGGIVGAALGASLLTFLICFLFFRRKRRERSSRVLRKSYSSNPVTFIEEKPTKSDSSNVPWQAYLPQSADDQTVQDQVKALFDQIDLHVGNFYRKASMRPDTNLAAAIARVDSGLLPGRVEELVQSSRLCRPVVKHVLSHILVSAMSPSNEVSETLLPGHLTLNPTRLDASTLRSHEASAARQAYSDWKRLSAYLCPRPQDDPRYAKEMNRISSEISDALDGAFASWRSQSDDNTFRHNLRSLVHLAGDIAVKLMSQSWDFKFTWAEPGISAEATIVTLPGLVKLTDDSGRLLETSQLLVAPTIVRI